jgi:hypothetical protein
MARRASKVDGNHGEIVKELRKAGAAVLSLAPIGKGCPDALVSWCGWMWLFEFKNPAGKDEVNDAQQKWHAGWKAPVFVARTADEALRTIGAIR